MTLGLCQILAKWTMSAQIALFQVGDHFRWGESNKHIERREKQEKVIGKAYDGNEIGYQIDRTSHVYKNTEKTGL